LQGLKNVTRKTARVNPDLIDVDLVRGIYYFIVCEDMYHQAYDLSAGRPSCLLQWYLGKMLHLSLFATCFNSQNLLKCNACSNYYHLHHAH